MKLPRVLSLRHAKNPVNGIVIWALVASKSRPTKLTHTVTAEKVGRGLVWRCLCERGGFAPREVCLHRKAVLKKLHRAA